MDVKITKQFILLTSILLFVSCFDGTDFDQTNEVVLTPEIELDLIYFNLEASNFYDYANNTEVLVVEDTTETFGLSRRFEPERPWHAKMFAQVAWLSNS